VGRWSEASSRLGRESVPMTVLALSAGLRKGRAARSIRHPAFVHQTKRQNDEFLRSAAAQNGTSGVAQVSQNVYAERQHEPDPERRFGDRYLARPWATGKPQQAVRIAPSERPGCKSRSVPELVMTPARGRPIRHSLATHKRPQRPPSDSCEHPLIPRWERPTDPAGPVRVQPQCLCPRTRCFST